MANKFNILYVDNTISNAITFKELFTDSYNIFTAKNGIEGLEILKKEDIAIIISELNLPGLSGLVFLQKAMQINALALRILLSEKYDLKAIKTAINKVQIFHFSENPWDSNELKQVLANALKNYKLKLEDENRKQELLEKTAALEVQLETNQKILTQLKFSERYLKNIINTAGSMIITLSTDYKIIQWNLEAELQFDLPLSKVVFKSFTNLINIKKDRLQIIKQLKKNHKKGGVVSFEGNIIKSNGNISSILWNISPLFDDKNNQIGFIVIGQNINEIKEAKLKRKESEELYRLLSENSNEVIWTMNSELKLSFVSPAIKRLLGFSENEVINQSIQTVFEENSFIKLKSKIAQFFNDLSKGVKNKSHLKFQLQQTKKNGDLIWTEVIIHKIFDKKSSFEFFLGISRDISKRVIAESKLRLSEEKFSRIFHSSPDVIYLTTYKESVLVDANGKLFELLEYVPTELIGKSTLEMDLWVDINDRNAYLKLLQNENKVTNFEAQFKAKSGKILTGLISGELIQLHEDKLVLGIIRDITQRKIREEALRKSEEQFRTMYENSVVGFYKTSCDGKILMANPTLISMLGYQNIEELSKINLQQSGFSGQEPRSKFQNIIEKYGRVMDLEALWIRKDGTELYVSESARGIKDLNGNIIYYEGTVIDITDRKITEKALIGSESLFKAITQQAIEGISLINLNYEFELTNEAFTKITGYTSTELKGVSVNKVINESLSKKFFRAIEKNGYEYAELQMLKKNGSYYFAEIKGNKIKIGSKDLVMVLLNDVSERHSTEQAMRKSESRLREAQKLAHFGHWDYNFINKKMAWSDEVYKILGLNKKSHFPTLSNSLALVHIDDKKKLIDSFFRSLSTKKRLKTTHRIVKSDGDIRYITEYVKTTIDENGKPQVSLGTIQDVTEIKKAEEEIRRLNKDLELKVEQRTREFKESEKKFRDLVQFVPDGIALIDKTGTIQLINKQLKKIFGYSEKELLGESINTLIPVKYHEKHKFYFQKYINKPINREMGSERDITGRNKSGQTFPVDISLGSVMIENELNVIAIIRDITKRKKYQNDLLKLTQAIEQSPVGVIIMDNNTTIEYVNPKFASDSGYNPNELIGRNANILLYDTGNENVEQRINKSIQNSENWNGDILNKRKNGDVYWARILVAPILDNNGETINIISLQTDITDVKRQEELLKFTTYSFDNSADAAYWLESNSGKFIHANKVGIRRLGYTQAEFLKLSVFDIDQKFNSLHEWKEFSIFLIEKGDHIYESLYKKKNGDLFPVEIISSTIEYEGKVYFIASVRDITEMKRTNEELHQAKLQAESANQTKSKFLANMSHEIRTPLNAVLGITDLLSQQITDEVQRSYLNTIKTSGKSLLAIINDILDISKIEVGKLDINYSYFSLKDLIKELEEMFALNTKEKGLQLTIIIPENIPTNVYLDENKLRQVLTNLLSNAVKFTDSGYIIISVGISEEQCRKDDEINLLIEVEDSGIGIKQGYIGAVFDAFSQQEGQDSRKYGGTGLGLAISKRLIELMQGTLELKSKKGKGTLISIKFQNVKFSNESVHKSIAYPTINKQYFLPSKVLIVDDIEENRKYLTGAFKGTSVEVFIAENGVEAFELALKHRPDIIITDLVMPVMDGFDLCEKIKRHKELKKTPIIANSAAVLGLTQQQLDEAHFDIFIPKPVPLEQLYSHLAQHLPYQEPSEIENEEKENTSEFTDELRKEMNVKTFELWKELEVHQKMSQVQQFISEIKKLGDEYNNKSLLVYSKKLDAAISSYDVSEILKLIKQYQEFLHVQ